MDPCGISWRGAGGEWPSGGATDEIAGVAGSALDDHAYGANPGEAEVRTGERLLFSFGPAICDEAVLAAASSEVGGGCGDGVLAEFYPHGESERRTHRRGECANL